MVKEIENLSKETKNIFNEFDHGLLHSTQNEIGDLLGFDDQL